MTVKQKVFSHSLGDQVRDALKEEITSGRLKPNERIDLNEYAQKWSISPTPLRDAVKNLETTGLVEIQPRRGVFVAALDRDGLRETFELRTAFEGMAARLSTVRVPKAKAQSVLDEYLAADRATGVDRERRLHAADDAVHDLVYEFCNNKRLQRMMDSARDLILWSKQTIIRNIAEPYETTLPEHIAICERIVAGDANGAELAMRTHLDNSFARVQAHLDGAERS